METYEHQRDLRAPELKMAATAGEESVHMVRDDFTGPSRLREDEPRWVQRPLNDLPDFCVSARGGRPTFLFHPEANMQRLAALDRQQFESAPLVAELDRPINGLLLVHGLDMSRPWLGRRYGRHPAMPGSVCPAGVSRTSDEPVHTQLPRAATRTIRKAFWESCQDLLSLLDKHFVRPRIVPWSQKFFNCHRGRVLLSQ